MPIQLMGPFWVLDEAQRLGKGELDLEIGGLLVVRGDGVLWIRQLELLAKVVVLLHPGRDSRQQNGRIQLSERQLLGW